MDLMDVIRRSAAPIPWAEGDNIPWHDPAFSERMLKEHLSQTHDAASRRSEKIDGYVQWIHRELLSERPTHILDLGCGPGLYTSRLAELGHECVGIDYSPASIAYAVGSAKQEKLHCTYVQQDMRHAEYGAGFGLVMLIYGELNIFRPGDARNILKKARAALADDGLLLLEPHPYAVVERIAAKGRTWYSAETGLFSGRPHYCFQESCWDATAETATTRYYIIDAATGAVARYASSFQAYTDSQYSSLLVESGFDNVKILPSLGGVEDEAQMKLISIVARKHRVSAPT